MTDLEAAFTAIFVASWIWIILWVWGKWDEL